MNTIRYCSVSISFQLQFLCSRIIILIVCKIRPSLEESSYACEMTSSLYQQWTPSKSVMNFLCYHTSVILACFPVWIFSIESSMLLFPHTDAEITVVSHLSEVNLNGLWSRKNNPCIVGMLVREHLEQRSTLQGHVCEGHLSLEILKIFTINSCLSFLFISLENHHSLAACILVPLGSYVSY